MSKATFKRVRRFVHAWTQIPLRNITPQASLYLDLQLDLERAQAFFAQFAAEFGVNLDTFDLTPHFLPEPHHIHDGVVGAAFALFLTVD